MQLEEKRKLKKKKTLSETRLIIVSRERKKNLQAKEDNGDHNRSQ
jgi:hypothetical protein